MKVKKSIENLDEKLLDCSLVLFGDCNLDSLTKAEDVRDYFSKEGILNYFNIKFMPERSVIELRFYTMKNKYEMSENIKSAAKKMGFGIAYRIKKIEEL
ncbi:MAG: hypothetical protein BJBARM5_0814 [Candidatus Parvarchaeum acidophilus ARMAN-5]|jgi:hypothetical protein|uniref:Uncharacterized protein n=1 Tax=Candidatus Parvarchaeum acidophilus ARMAN-5 TaxID=662762 RepID=D6GWD2_PARA5|nr:MAG: hypothetical protein BJBARM5_0814 [Candidatus Parvarchaeum acidophilus ARMAN-5]